MVDTSFLDLPGIAAFFDAQARKKSEQERYDWTFPLEEDRPYTPREVRSLIKIAQMETEVSLRTEFQRQMRATVDDAIECLRAEFERKLEHHVAPPAVVEQKRPLPDPQSIVKLHAQLFENFRKPPERRIKTQAHVQLKLYVWTCSETNHQPQRINGYWLIPLHRPDRTEGRKRIKEIMPHVDELGRDQVQYAGRLVNSIEFYVGHNKRLTMRLNGEWSGFEPPRSKRDDDDEDASVLRWDWESRKAF